MDNGLVLTKSEIALIERLRQLKRQRPYVVVLVEVCDGEVQWRVGGKVEKVKEKEKALGLTS